MGLFSRIFGNKKKKENSKQNASQSNIVDVSTEDEKMNWAMEKAQITLHYFEECLVNPKPNQQYFSIKVKIVDEPNVEHIWLTNPEFDDEGNLFGVIGNEPSMVKTVSLNQKIGIEKSLVSDWMIIENGRLIGGYTIRAIRDNLPESELQDFDKNLGGMFVDEGEDYLTPSKETPEGAILLLEEAYDNDDLEKALNCKDFEKEAELMLSKMGELDQELINQTAEVLKLSFIKSLEEGMPKFGDMKRAFPKREKISENHMIITEVCYYPDGSTSRQRLNTYKTENEWKVLNPED